jgi:hypothetical protein
MTIFLLPAWKFPNWDLSKQFEVDTSMTRLGSTKAHELFTPQLLDLASIYLV